MSLQELSNACACILSQHSTFDGRILWCANGTTALTTVLRAVKSISNGKDKKVIIPTCVCPHVYVAVLAAGLEPVMVATNPRDNYALDWEALDAYPDRSAMALVWVHQYGCVAHVDRVRQICRAKDWVVLEDAALAFGAMTSAGVAGTLGDCGIFSFGKGKVICVDYGGAIVLKNTTDAVRGLSKAIEIEWKTFNKDGTAEDCAHNFAEFARELRRLYNDFYSDFQQGACAAHIQSMLSGSIDIVQPLNPKRLLSCLTPSMILQGTMLAAKRRARADWLSKIISSPKINIVYHAEGTYWRLNIVVDKEKRHRLLKDGISKGLAMSSWHPPLYWMVANAYIIGDTKSEVEFADTLLNVWVDDIQDWESYAQELVRLFN
jgi:DegT/DnrJ/EryC1/StrS aminotransferase family